MSAPDQVHPQLSRIQSRAFVAGVAGIVVCVILRFIFGDAVQLLRSYLFAFVFWFSIPIGCTSILMLHHLTGGWWGYPIRRLLEAGTRTFPVMALLIVPVLLGMSRLYEWAQPDKVAADSVILQIASSDVMECKVC